MTETNRDMTELVYVLTNNFITYLMTLVMINGVSVNRYGYHSKKEELCV